MQIDEGKTYEMPVSESWIQATMLGGIGGLQEVGAGVMRVTWNHHPVVAVGPDQHHPLRLALSYWFRQSARSLRSEDRGARRCWGRQFKLSVPDRCRSVLVALSIDGTEPP